MANGDGLTAATEADDVADYLAACRSTFRDELEVDRINRYCGLVADNPGAPVHMYRLAKACLEGGNLALWRRGVALTDPMPHDTPRSLCDRGDARLRLGDWDAWKDLESLIYHPDWGISTSSSLSWTRGRWDGREDLSQKTLLVVPVGGFGDSIWSLRFVEAIAPRARRIIWDTAPSLLGFVRHNVGHLVDVVTVQSDDDAAACDRYIYAMSLPSIVGAVPPFVRRSAPTPHRVTRRTRLRIGLAWSCSLDGHDHLERSLPLSVIAPLFWRTDIEWVNLQVGPRAADADYYPTVTKPDPPTQSFADTANLIAGLDGVIAVDTSVCHLAGVLGVPTLTLLRFPSEVKWGLGEHSTWYPAMRLIRQPSRGDWASVVAMVRQTLDSNWWFTPCP